MADADLCTIRGQFRERNTRKNKKGCRDSIPFLFSSESAQTLVTSTAQCVTASNHPVFSDGII
jgi:hypothetical protein